MFMPNTGNVLTSTGSKAQCMAQAIEVAMPNASQFNFTFIFIMGSKDSIFAIRLQVLPGEPPGKTWVG